MLLAYCGSNFFTTNYTNLETRNTDTSKLYNMMSQLEHYISWLASKLDANMASSQSLTDIYSALGLTSVLENSLNDFADGQVVSGKCTFVIFVKWYRAYSVFCDVDWFV